MNSLFEFKSLVNLDNPSLKLIDALENQIITHYVS